MSLASLPGLFLNRQNRRIYVRLLTLAPAVGGLVLLFFVENFSSSMIIMNIWTVALAALVLLQGMIVSQINKENSVK